MLNKSSILLLFVLILLNACSKPAAVLDAIPENAALVGVLDMAEWAKSAEKPYMSNLIDDLKNNLDQSSPEANELLNKIIKNPQSTGIDFRERVYAYYFQNSNQNTYIGVNLPLRDGKSFQKFLQDLAEQDGGSLDIQSESTFKYVSENDIAIGWDDSKAMMLVAENRSGSRGIIEQMKSQFEMDPTQSISSQSSFVEFNKRDLTLAVWGNMDLISEMQNLPIQKPADINEPIILMAFLTMSNDAMSLRAEVSPKVNLMEIATGFDMLGTNFDPDGMKLLPKNSYLVTGFAMNPSGMYDFMRSEGLTRDLSYELETNFGWTLDDLMNNLNGSIVLAVSKFSPKVTYEYFTDEYIETDELEPVVNIILGFKNDQALNRFIQSANDNLEFMGEPLYQITFSGTPYYLAVLGNQLVLSNHYSGVEDYADVYRNSSTYYDSKMVASSKNTSMFAHMNLDMEDYPDQMRDELRAFDLDRATLEIINQFAKRVELKFENTGAVEVRMLRD
jgi:hypothetical protein